MAGASTGAGGSVHGVWPRERMSFSYAMSDMRISPDGDARFRGSLEALYACVRRGESCA